MMAKWALVSPDGVVPSQMICVSASVNLPVHHKVQKFSSGTSSPRWSQKKGHKTVVVWCGYIMTVTFYLSLLSCWLHFSTLFVQIYEWMNEFLSLFWQRIFWDKYDSFSIGWKKSLNCSWVFFFFQLLNAPIDGRAKLIKNFTMCFLCRVSYA